MNYVDILYYLSKLETIIYDVYQDECDSCEGSLSSKELYDITYFINNIRKIINDNLREEDL